MSHQLVEQAINLLKEQRYYDSMQGLMGWDIWQGLSNNGNTYRNEVRSFLTKQASEQLLSPETAKLLLKLEDIPESSYNSPYEKAAIRALRHRYDRSTKVPLELRTKMRNFTSNAQKVWQEAVKLDSFEHYKPYLKELFELKLQVANAIDPNKNPFDLLCDGVDEGIDTAEVGRIFAALKTGIKDILAKTPFKDMPDHPIASITADTKRIRDFAYEVNALTGYDYGSGRDSETVHGMCTAVGPKDSRIAISYTKSPWGGMFTMLHEGGHGRYEHGSCKEAIDCSVWGGVSGAMHEGQARFYENMIGRSLPFIKHIFPVIQKHFPEIGSATAEDFYKAVNKPAPSLIRIGADELTYSLHPIIRFEMEQDYFNGKINTDQFMKIWNEKYEECFSLTPTTMRNGVLQDIHWASGHIGYFQSYTLGNLYCGQLLETMLKKYPNLYQDMEKGDISNINNFLYENIHQYGEALYTPEELIVNATGEKLSEKYFLNYLRNKYLDISL